MSDINKNSTDKSGKQGSTVALPPIVKALQEKSLLVLSKMLGEMFDSADDAFYDMAERAHNQAEQTLYFDSMRELRVKRKGIEAGFKKAIFQSFEVLSPQKTTFSSTLSQAENLFHENLSLVHNEELEEDLAIDSVADKARSRNTTTLKQLAARLGAVMGQEYEPEDIPFDPQWPCRAFAEGCSSLDLDLKSRLLFYKLFDRNVMSNLSLLLNQTNQYMLEQGVLPELRVHAMKARTSSHDRGKQVVNQAFGTEDNDSAAGAASELSSVGIENFTAFQQLMNQSGMSTFHIIPGAPIIVGKDLIQTLSELQSAMPAVASGSDMSSMSTDELRQLLSTNTSLSKVPNFAEDDCGVIDVVAMLFDFILDDKNLPVEIKALVARLQIPVVKLAIMDKGFFSKKVHPARKLLNLLAKAGVSFSHQEKSSELLVTKIESIVSRILNDFSDNPHIFAELLVEFSDFLKGDEKRRNILERRVCEAEQGKAKSEVARSKVQEVLADIYDGNFIPVAIEALVEGAWEQVMFLTLTREGEESEAWKRILTTVSKLVSSVQKGSNALSKKELAQLLPILLVDLKAGFESIGLDKLSSARLLKGLAECHRATLTGKDVEGVWYGEVPEELKETGALEADTVLDDEAPTLDPVVAAEKKETDGIEDGAPTLLMDKVDIHHSNSVRVKVRPRKVEIVADKHEVPEGLEDFVKQVQAYESGTWFEVKVKSESVRCKLAAKIPATHKFLFVSRSGMKVAEYSDIELATLLRDGGVKVLDDSALFDRALESVITNLRQAQKSA